MVAPASLPTLELTILRRGCFVFLPQLGSALRRIVVSVLNGERYMSISEGHYIVEQSVPSLVGLVRIPNLSVRGPGLVRQVGRRLLLIIVCIDFLATRVDFPHPSL